MKSKRNFLLIFILVFLIQGCSYRMGDMTLVSTRNIAKEKIDLSKTSSQGVFEGVDYRHIIIFIPTGIANIEEAIDKALDAGGGSFMTDVVLYYKWWYIPYIYGRTSMVAKGKVHKLES